MISPRPFYLANIASVICFLNASECDTAKDKKKRWREDDRR